MPVFVRFIADRGFVSRAIGWRTDGIPSHIEFVLLDGGLKTTLGARLGGGIGIRPLNYCKPTWEEWYTAPGIEASYAEAVKFSGRKYDWRDIVYDAVGIYPATFDPGQFICSCFVAYANRRAWASGNSPAWVNPSLPTRRITPELLYGSGVFQQVQKEAIQTP